MARGDILDLKVLPRAKTYWMPDLRALGTEARADRGGAA